MRDDIAYIEGFGFSFALVFNAGSYHAACDWGEEDHDYYELIETDSWADADDAIAELADMIADMVGEGVCFSPESPRGSLTN